MKIYTRTGDHGTTSLFAGERVPKDDSFVEAVGAVDECNCAIGVALSFLPKEKKLDQTRQQLDHIQHALFDIGAAIATPLSRATEQKRAKTRFDVEEIALLEKWIDEMETQLEPLHTFILPGGHQAGAFLHLARSLVRRAERAVAPLFQKKEVHANVLTFLNRLSDYLFVVSRHVNHVLGVPETKWKTY